eukprot:PhF_6_TR31718/c1_g1_i1/m.46676
MVSTYVYMWGVRLEVVIMTEGCEECVYLNVENGTNGTVAVFDPLQWHISNSKLHPKRWFMHQSTRFEKRIPHDFFEGMMNVSLFINRTKSSRCWNLTVVHANVSWTLEYVDSLFSMSTQKYYSNSEESGVYNPLQKDEKVMMSAEITSMESREIWNELFEKYQEDDDVIFLGGWMCGRGLGNGTWIWECGADEGKPFTFTNWAPGEPKLSDGCLYVEGTVSLKLVRGGYWYAHPCDTSHCSFQKKTWKGSGPIYGFINTTVVFPPQSTNAVINVTKSPSTTKIRSITTYIRLTAEIGSGAIASEPVTGAQMMYYISELNHACMSHDYLDSELEQPYLSLGRLESFQPYVSLQVLLMLVSVIIIYCFHGLVCITHARIQPSPLNYISSFCLLKFPSHSTRYHMSFMLPAIALCFQSDGKVTVGISAGVTFILMSSLCLLHYRLGWRPWSDRLCYVVQTTKMGSFWLRHRGSWHPPECLPFGSAFYGGYRGDFQVVFHRTTTVLPHLWVWATFALGVGTLCVRYEPGNGGCGWRAGVLGGAHILFGIVHVVYTPTRVRVISVIRGCRFVTMGICAVLISTLSFNDSETFHTPFYVSNVCCIVLTVTETSVIVGIYIRDKLCRSEPSNSKRVGFIDDTVEESFRELVEVKPSKENLMQSNQLN